MRESTDCAKAKKDDGNMMTYEQSYALLFEDLFRYAFSILKNREAAEDAVSDVFVKLWKMKDDLDQVENLKCYLFRATKNHCLNFLTKTPKNRFVQYEEVDDSYYVDSEATVSPEQIYISNEINALVHKAIQELPPQCREIFKMVKFKDLHYKEVATALNISKFTVRNQIVIASRRLSRILACY
ncbi:RNA polymerase sigma-70 factor [Arachidicoccus terrestris]|uniref:RNA polymerase sigma-70 factor n=1 Tax=Arachidicoccus terrestris TaxID=2875539 RepID=UPI001CC77BDC|nr:RNA polymerase sigma-70 factor [Arachidicoccus terrestris]UAY57036.1 RNA polymerase sigma-70 factor [Arachidicoccus terrestris]